MGLEGELEKKVALVIISHVVFESKQNNHHWNKDEDHCNHRVKNVFLGEEPSPYNLSDANPDVVPTDSVDHQITCSVGREQLSNCPYQLCEEDDSPDGKGVSRRSE
mmetsp:Transcript_37880/g.91856  ORF Transcript_37880/g.91856 Transcript_37880/m.91856 type:complete len:106 (+) Transcript_37880:507-824(+)